MLPLSKYHIFSAEQQKICILIYHEGEITFNSQEIYKKNASFKRAMRELKKINAIEIGRKKRFPFTNTYTLTKDGKIFVEKALRL
jgi:hypothetical protein